MEHDSANGTTSAKKLVDSTIKEIGYLSKRCIRILLFLYVKHHGLEILNDLFSLFPF